MKAQKKVAYICGPLTELPPDEHHRVKEFYSKLGNICEVINGARGFVPHEHFDPIIHSNYTPTEVDSAERHQVCKCTCVLIVIAIAPSWGGGIEVEMANQNNVPVIILRPFGKKVSRLLLGNPSVLHELCYESEEHAVGLLENCLRNLFNAGAIVL